MSGKLESVAVARALEVGAASAKGSESDEAARRAILDGLSVAAVGVSHPQLRIMRENMAFARATIGNQNIAPVFFTNYVAPASLASLLNGAAMHAFDFDDTHDAAIVHCMAAVLPAAFAGFQKKMDYGLFVAAVISGTELACNIALAKGHYSGWHYTALCGSMGAAAAYCVALGAPSETVESAVGNAYALAGGNKQCVLDSSIMKRMLPGHATQTGVVSGEAALAGFSGVASWISGKYGLFELFYEGDARPEMLEGGAKSRIEELSFKPYPACRFTHGAIEAALSVRDEYAALGITDFLELDIPTVRYPSSDQFALVCRPYERRGFPEMDAQFSTSYLVGACLLRGPITFESYQSEALGDSTVSRLAERIVVAQDLTPARDGALVPVEVRVGDVVGRVDCVKGSPECALSLDDMKAKWEMCTREHVRSFEVLGQDVALPSWDRLITVVMDQSDGEPDSLVDIVLGGRC